MCSVLRNWATALFSWVRRVKCTTNKGGVCIGVGGGSTGSGFGLGNNGSMVCRAGKLESCFALLGGEREHVLVYDAVIE